MTGHPSPVVLDRYLGSGQEGLGGICASTGAGDSLASVLGLTTQDLDMIEQVTITTSSASNEALNACNMLTDCLITDVRTLDKCNTILCVSLLRRYDYYNQGWWCEALYYPICTLFISLP